MENRLVKLKMDDTKNEEDIKKEMVEIESECVSKTVFFFHQHLSAKRAVRNVCIKFHKIYFQENHLTELNNMFVKIDDRRRVSKIS